MDRLDFELIAGLFKDPRASYEGLGTSVGLSGSAVKARLRRMQSDGLLQGFAAWPAPSALGLHEGLIVFTSVDEIEEKEEDVLRNLPDVSGVRYVDVTHDRSIVVWLLFSDDADWERIERAAISIIGKPPSWDLRFPMATGPEELAPSDWKIARSLVQDGRLALKEIVRRSNVSFKTVKRRLDMLLQTRGLQIEPVLSASEAEGCTLATHLVVLREGASAQGLLALLPDTTILLASRADPRFVVLHVQRRNLKEAQEDHRALKRSPLVDRSLFLISTRRRSPHWVEEASSARLAKALAPRAPPVPVPVPRAPPSGPR